MHRTERQVRNKREVVARVVLSREAPVCNEHTCWRHLEHTVAIKRVAREPDVVHSPFRARVEDGELGLARAPVVWVLRIGARKVQLQRARDCM